VGAPKDRLRFAFASCQHYGQGYFTAYEAMMKDDLDLIVHLGDYIYECSWGPKVRFHLPEPMTLERYRNLHALYKSDRSLQAAHAWHPFAVTWDDHEVDNDYAAEHSEDQVEAFLRRRAAAYQAYYEHMPLRPTARPIGPDMTLYATLTFGDLASFMMLDNRQYRSDQACQGPEEFGGQVIEDCAEREQEDRSILGPEQERWLRSQLAGTPRTLESDRPADAYGPARAEAGRGRGLVVRRVGRLSGRAPAPPCPNRRAEDRKRRGDRRRHPLVLGHRSQARLWRSRIADRGHRVRRHVGHLVGRPL
jgi:hypothetical protein